MSDNSLIHDTIRDILHNRVPQSIDTGRIDYIHSAVLIPLFKDNGEHMVLLTKRSINVEHHKGQMSFPGGAVEENDRSFMETALREAHEEVGLLKKDVTILGQIDDKLTLVSNFVIHPFVGMFPYPYDFRINSEEVHSLVKVPLSLFISTHSIEDIADIEYGGKIYKGPVFRYEGEVIWGATARIMKNFVEILGPSLNPNESNTPPQAGYEKGMP
jgi:8-oxo-dGTP pyrophosphatase MutT (NUDIX family)